MVRLSTDLSDPDAAPYFLWDQPMSVRELREWTRGPSTRLARLARP